MILSKPFDKNQLVAFNPYSLTAIPLENISEKPVGNLHFVGKHCVAIYCEKNDLFIQIDTNKWSLSSGNLNIKYFHKKTSRTTFFSIEEGEKIILIEYESWWKDIPGFMPMEPEMDEDEDFLGYVFSVWRNKKLQQSLVLSWK